MESGVSAELVQKLDRLWALTPSAAFDAANKSASAPALFPAPNFHRTASMPLERK
jgi:hypothetical protein